METGKGGAPLLTEVRRTRAANGILEECLKELSEELARNRPGGPDDLYRLGFWDGAVFALACCRPELFYALFPEWLEVKKRVAEKLE